MSSQLYIGMMSGTSADGVDAALVEFDKSGEFSVRSTLYCRYSAHLRNSVNHSARSYRKICKNDLAKLDLELADFYAQSVQKLLQQNDIDSATIRAIANHGQTIKHEPSANPPVSLQIGDPQHIATLTGIRTISRFRQADLEQGGQGAPLMPAFHARYFSAEQDRMIVNIGGIANLTLLPSDSQRSVLGYDTGPGNTLMDQWILKHQAKRFDRNGDWAASAAQCDETLLKQLLSEPYFSLPTPKSTGPDFFNLEWLDRQAGSIIHSLAPEVVQRTLCELTARSIANAINVHLGSAQRFDVLICGGGAHNSFLLKRLAYLLPNAAVKTTDSLGLPADWVEAVGFAWLGYCFDNGLASNLPSVTGARSQVVLGEAFSPKAI